MVETFLVTDEAQLVLFEDSLFCSLPKEGWQQLSSHWSFLKPRRIGKAPEPNSHQEREQKNYILWMHINDFTLMLCLLVRA